MPLSDYERRRLHELEAELAADGPALARKLAKDRSSRLPLHWSVGIVLALGGCALMILGFSAQLAGLGVLGFLLVFGDAMGYAWRWALDPGGPG
ncbi:DUF3040 domain-containing protein [Arthrobacter sp. 2MCAF15]|uniref:DUF3040 domain-containing protein n=1 Tax=Arthrobacter sp. 2MCAF15 TaxID=3232984 RepID=UPI003F8E79DD